MKKTFVILSVLSTLVVLSRAAAPQYKVLTKIEIGGEVRWDDLYIDSENHRAYISHNSQVEVINTQTDTLVGTIHDTPGVHGIAIANDLKRGFVTYSGTAGVVPRGTPPSPGNLLIFDLTKLEKISVVKVGSDPDSVNYDPVTQRVVTFNDRSSDATIVDAKTGTVLQASLPLGGKPAGSQADGKGHAYVNIENREDDQEMVEVTLKSMLVTKHYALEPCDDSSGLAIDVTRMRLYTACSNKMVVVSDPATGKVIGWSPSGAGTDSIAFDDGYVFTPNATDSTISMVGETSPGKFTQVTTFPMALRARILGADQKLHKLYVPAAEYGAAPAGGRGRAPAVAGTFRIDVYGR